MEDFQAVARRFINTTKNHLFLTGKAGTGKTTFLKNLGSITHKNFIVVAPTGIAALNAGGVTIHSQFLLPLGTFIPEEVSSQTNSNGGLCYNSLILGTKHPLSSVRKQVLRSIDLLVIDEVSMLRADILDAIDYRMKAVRGNFRQSFGGVQVLFIGDLFQLPPVVRRDEEKLLGRFYRTPWFYEAKALELEPLVLIELDKIFRQSDERFIGLLNRLRNNQITTADVALLNESFRTEQEIAAIENVITLTTHNHKADAINEKALRSLPSTSKFFRATIEGDFPESMYPVLESIELKVGAQIMFVRNDPDGGYYNGKLARVAEINGTDIWVEFPGGDRYKLKKERWENKKYHVQSDQTLEEEIVGSFEQHPIKLAWAITVHKSQGLTFDKAIIDVGEAFAEGQVYVALSRLRSLEGLVLRTRVNADTVKTDKNIVSFTAKYQPEQLQAMVKKGQEEFIRHLIDNTFSFENVIRELRYVLKRNDDGVSKTHVGTVNQICSALEKEKENTNRFRAQLMSLVGNEVPKFRERLGKGVEYYEALLWDQLKVLLTHIEELKRLKRVKGYMNDIADVEVVMSKKIKEMMTASTVIQSILDGTEDELRTHLQDELLVERRQRVLAEAIEQLPKPASKTSRVRKGKKKKANADGDDRSTYDITFDYFKDGLTIKEIAVKRELALSTIEGHLARAVEMRRISLSEFMEAHDVGEVKAALAAYPDATISEIYHHLGRKYSHALIRAVIFQVGSENPPNLLASAVNLKLDS